MAYSRIVYGNPNGAYNYSEFVCDTVDDLNNLPTNAIKGDKNEETCSVGSKATVVSEKKVYILNNKNEWVLLIDYNESANGGGSTFTLTVEDDGEGNISIL